MYSKTVSNRVLIFRIGFLLYTAFVLLVTLNYSFVRSFWDLFRIIDIFHWLDRFFRDPVIQRLPANDIHSWPEFIVNFLANIILFVPMGVLGSLSLKKLMRNAMLLVIFCALLSAGIEWTQFFSLLRNSDLYDFLSNTLGAAIGVWIIYFNHHKRFNFFKKQGSKLYDA